MTYVRVGEVADQIRGVTYGKEDVLATESRNGVPVLRANNIAEDGLVFDDLVYIADRQVSERQRLRVGDIVIAASSGSLSVVGKAAQLHATFDGAFGAFCKVVRPGPQVNPRYLGHFFRTPDYRRKISSLAAGANINNLKSADIDNLEIPLPPLPEQQRIAAILDQADALRRKRRASLARLDDLGTATFASMFGDLMANSRGWRRGLVGDIVSHFESGRNLIASDDAPENPNFRVLKISAVTSLRFDPEASKPLPYEYEVPLAHRVRLGDLLFSRANTEELIGATAYVDVKCDGLALPDKLWRFCWHDEQRAVPLFVWKLFTLPAFRHQLRGRSTGTSGSMKNISQEKVLSIEIGIPGWDGQRAYATALSAIRKEERNARIQLDRLDSLFASLQHRAFRGEL